MKWCIEPASYWAANGRGSRARSLFSIQDLIFYIKILWLIKNLHIIIGEGDEHLIRMPLNYCISLSFFRLCILFLILNNRLH